ncbi:hypothetical protein Ate02nite_28310 [Paractinoplanes tereljensis]|uniref:Uncharacterized protein n=1 Tax=Paractinoplanes tereljensis TaxID=571912 RepID=A0A919NJW9_9ACTN|nr:hypothetical protein Ate02nite_28310 [Actinoplanes tereljensis]
MLFAANRKSARSGGRALAVRADLAVRAVRAALAPRAALAALAPRAPRAALAAPRGPRGDLAGLLFAADGKAS